MSESAAEKILADNLAEWKARVKASGKRAWREWVGKTADSAIPPSVVLRIIETWGRQCYLTGVSFGALTPDMEHKLALHACQGLNGNRESNLRPVLPAAHKKKTAKEKQVQAKVDAQAIAHMGLKKTKHPIPQPPKLPKPVKDKLPLPARTHDIFGRPI